MSPFPHLTHPTLTSSPTDRHSCGHRQTTHPLPQVVRIFARGSPGPCPGRASKPDVSKAACPACQLATETGVFEAVYAVHCVDSPLVDSVLLQHLFLTLVRLCQRQLLQIGGDDCSGSGSGSDDGGGSGGFGKQQPITATPFDWAAIWPEWAKAFELNRREVHLPELMRNLADVEEAKMAVVGGSGGGAQSWWADLLRLVGTEAFLSYRCYVDTGCVGRVANVESSASMRALERAAESIQSVRDLEAFLGWVDERVGEVL